MGNFVARVSLVPLNRPRITRGAQRGRTSASRQPHRQFNHYTTASQLRANCRKLQPIGNRPSTVTSTILQPPSNHQSSASRHLFVRHSAAPIHPPRTRTSPTRAHTTPSPIRRADYPQPSFNRHTNHLSIAFQPPPTRSSPKPPPIRRDKDGHPLPSHAAPRRLATMPKHGKGGRAEARPPHYAPPPPTKH